MQNWLVRIRPQIVPCLGAIIVFWLYSYVFTHDYVLLDDVTASINAKLPNQTIDYYAAEGRPLFGYALKTWRFSDSIEFFRYIRLYSLITAIALYYLLLHLLKQLIPHNIVRVSAATCMMTLPTVSLFVLWATLFHAITGSILSILAGIIALHTARNFQSLPKRQTCLRIGLSIAMLLVALMLYQSVTMLFFFVLFTYFLSSAPKQQAVTKNIGIFMACCTVYGIANVVYFISYKFQFPPFNITDTSNEFIMSRLDRAALASSLTDKIGWFLNECTSGLLNFTFIFEKGLMNSIIQVLTAIMILSVPVIALSQLTRKNLKTSLALGSILILCILASFHQNLLVGESTSRYRIATAYSFCLATLFFLGLNRTTSFLFKKNYALLAIFSILTATAFVSYARIHYDKYFVGMLADEAKIIDDAVRQVTETNTREVIVIPLAWQHQPFLPPPNMEFGFYNSSVWPAEALSYAAHLQTGELFYFHEIRVVDANNKDAERFPEGWPVIDLNQAILNSR